MTLPNQCAPARLSPAGWGECVAPTQRGAERSVSHPLPPQSLNHVILPCTVVGPRTTAAVRAYQKAEHLTMTGEMNPDTAAKLGVKAVRVQAP